MVDHVTRSPFYQKYLWSIKALTIALFAAGVCQQSSGPNAVALKDDTPKSAMTEFEVATIKPTPESSSGWMLQFTLDGFIARGVRLRQVIQEAYGVYEEDRMSGGPDWVSSRKFDIEAKFTSASEAGARELSLNQRRLMLQKLLADRFQLTVHHEAKQLPVFVLVLSKTGPKFHESQSDKTDENEIKGLDGLVLRSGSGTLEVRGMTMAGFAQILNNQLGRIVVDQTGLKGLYDLKLRWMPDELSPTSFGENAQARVTGNDSSGSPIFVALSPQLGLNLKSTQAQVDTIVIDHVDIPSEN
jgi:uncharacterized protein (TIGR03435 family)